MFRRDSGGPDRLRWWRREVALDQVRIVRDRVEVELVRRRLELNRKVAGPDDFEAIRQLELRLAAIHDSWKDLSRRPVKKPGLWDRFMLRLWKWSIRGKFDLP